MATTNFNFLQLAGTDYAGYTTINALIQDIDTRLNTRLPASATAASVIGRSAASAGATAAIAATTDGHVLRRASSVVGFGTIPQSSISDFVFTTEAARDAAITSPTEGMRAYITASTNASAVGDTYVGTPTGVQTIYNGSVWVCITEMGATTNTSGTTASTSYTTTLTSGGTNPAVSLVTGTQALVSLSVTFNPSTAPATCAMSFNVSGATTLAAADAQGIPMNVQAATRDQPIARTFVITGLTAGTNTFTLNYKTSVGTLTASARSVVVKGIA